MVGCRVNSWGYTGTARVRSWVARSGVKADRQAPLLGRGPQRVPAVIAREWLVEGLWGQGG